MTDKKRGPGRPPRKVVPNNPTNGIVDTPLNPNNIVEFHYYDPLVLRQLFVLFKQLKTEEIYFRFTADTFDILTKDHYDNKILASIDCTKVSHYYCKKLPEPLYLSTDRSNIQYVFLNINKDINNIQINYETVDNMLQIKLSNAKMSKEDTRDVLMCSKVPDDGLLNLEKKVNMILPVLSFSLPPKDFKDTITDIINYSDRFTLEKHGDGPLVFTFPKAHVNKCETEYNDPDKIALTHTLKENDSFNCVFYTSLLKSVSTSVANSNITFKCMDGNDAIIAYNIENVITFNINPKQ